MKPAGKFTFFTLYLIYILDLVGMVFVYIIVSPLIINPHFHMLASDTPIATRNLVIGLLFATYPFAQFFAAPIFGDLSDRFGRKRILVISTLGTTLSIALSAISIYMSSLSLLFISRLLSGIFAGNLTVTQATVANLAPDEKKAHYMAIFSAVGGIGWTIGPFVAAFLSDPKIFPFFDLATPFWFLASLFFLSFLFLIFSLQEPNQLKPGQKLHLSKIEPRECRKKISPEKAVHSEKVQGGRCKEPQNGFLKEDNDEIFSMKDKSRVNLLAIPSNLLSVFKVKNILVPFLASLFTIFGWMVYQGFLAPYLIEKYGFTERWEGYAYALSSLFWFFGGMLSNKWVLKHHPAKRAIIIPMFLSGLAVLLFLIAFRSYWTWPLMAIANLTQAIVTACFFTLFAQLVPPEGQGKIFGSWNAGFALASSLGPFLASIFVRFQINLPYLIAAAILIITGIYYLLWYRKKGSSLA
ncbi:MAG: MFS transporter [Chlamydiales bacterium]|nr:MFS transporter [Chlamydiales bacterium]